MNLAASTIVPSTSPAIKKLTETAFWIAVAKSPSRQERLVVRRERQAGFGRKTRHS
jgi:hypothetical protein